jgi:ribonuclease P protein component
MTANGLPSEGTGARKTAPSRLKNRPEFVAVSKGRRVHTAHFTLQAAERKVETLLVAARIGLTVTKKAGCSVERNRMRRRLREALRLHGNLPVKASCDYVLVARRELLNADFARLQAELGNAFQKIHVSRPPRGEQKS